jgi:hypothetical protein
MSSEIRPEDIEAAIAAAEQRRRSRLGNASEAVAAAAGGRRPMLPERIGPGNAPGKSSESSESMTSTTARPKSEEFDDSWLNQPIRPRPVASRFADLPESEVVWEPESNRRSLAIPFGIGAAILIIFGAILWWAYRSSVGETDGSVPVIAADEAPIKQKPAEEGGLEVPDQDKLVYNNLGQGEQGTGKVEQLLPPPEEPVKPAEPAQAGATQTPAPPPMTGTDEDTTAAPIASPQVPAATAPGASSQVPTGPSAVPPPPADSAAVQAQPAAPAAPTKEAAAPAPAAPAPAKEVAVATPAAPAASKPAKATAGSGGWKIQLASVKSDAVARQQWNRLQKVHSDLLGDMRLTVQQADLGNKGTFFRIQAGPLPDRTTAEDVCAELKAAKQPCIVVKP